MEPVIPNQRRQALARYADVLENLSPPPPLGDVPLAFDALPRLNEVRWRGSLFAELLVGGELSELTNTLNAWWGALRRWFAWMEVLDGFPEEDAWSLQWEFVESIAFQCMFYPSATRDRFTFVATNALHQVRMALDSAYLDRLDSDPKPGKEDKPRFLSRGQSEEQLERIAAPLAGSAAFVAALKSLDEDDYLRMTRNFRNLSSHAIAPRLNIGITRMVVRTVVPATTMVRQQNGSFNDEPVPGKQAVSYGFGGTPPLPMQDVFAANLAEFANARACFAAYVHVLNGALDDLPLRADLHEPEVQEAEAPQTDLRGRRSPPRVVVEEAACGKRGACLRDEGAIRSDLLDTAFAEEEAG